MLDGLLIGRLKLDQNLTEQLKMDRFDHKLKKNTIVVNLKGNIRRLAYRAAKKLNEKVI